MPAPLNPFKAALAAGQRQMGAWVGLVDAYVAEITATAGFDWLLLDGEHAPNDLRALLDQLRVVDASPSHAVIRLPMAEDWAIKQALDIGAQSLLIPLVESGAEADRLVRATRYPPDGHRGVGAALARASRFSAIPDYLGTANDQIWLAVQVETRRGLAALDDILATGVDGVFIGPADLAADMGHAGAMDAPEVKAAILDAIRRIRAAGKAPGILTLDPAFQRECLSAGAQFLATCIDVTTYAAAIRAAGQAASALRDD